MSALHPDVHISARSRYHYNVQEINIAYALLKEASLKDSGATCLSGGHQPGGTKKASGAAVDSVWDAPVNENAYRERNIYYYEEDREGQIIGHVMYMRAKIVTDSGGEVPVMTFGPISIRPDLQRQGLGKWLLSDSIERARALGTGALCIEGNIEFYGKSGFIVAGTRGIRYHGVPEQEVVSYFLLKELCPGFLDGITGVYHTPRGYYVNDAAVEDFDRNFPPKKKLKLPGQLL